MTLYDQLGALYARYRRPDARLTQALVDALQLPPGSKLADVGAGTGKYALQLAEAGYLVKAIEPSRVMLGQIPRHPGVEALEGAAEALPLGDASVDAAISVIALSHFPDLPRALAEMNRVTGGGRVVVITIDPREAESGWFEEYFPEVHARNLERAVPIAELTATFERALGRPAVARALPVPRDFADLFTGAAWSRPELYLDADYRSCAASFARAPAEAVEASVRRLASDLKEGRFAARFAALAGRVDLDVGLRLIDVAPRLKRASRAALGLSGRGGRRGYWRPNQGRSPGRNRGRGRGTHPARGSRLG